MTGRRKVGISVFVVLLLILVAGSFLVSRFVSRWRVRTLSSPNLVIRIKQLHQLATVRYSIQRVVGLTEPKVPFGEESILLIVQGEAEAGVNLADLRKDDVLLTPDGKALVRLPDAKMFKAYLDEKQIKVWDRHITWWTPWVPYSPDLEHRARLQALEEIRKAALDMGILDQAQTNAESAIRELLAAFQVSVKFEKHGA